MEKLKKRPVALLLALLIVAGSLVIGVNRSLGQEISAVGDQFFSGVYDPASGFTRPSIHSQLTRRATAAVRILSIGEHSHGDEASLREAGTELRAARADLVNLLEAGASPRVLHQADQVLASAVDRYYALLHPLVTAALGEDFETLEAEHSAMQSAARVISESGYNEAVGAFNRTVMGEFPIRILRGLIFVQPPELFA